MRLVFLHFALRADETRFKQEPRFIREADRRSLNRFDPDGTDFVLSGLCHWISGIIG